MPESNTANGLKVTSLGPNGSQGQTVGDGPNELGGFHGAASIQHESGGEGTIDTFLGGTSVSSLTLFSGGIDASGYTIGDIVKALKEKGILKPDGGVGFP